MKAEAGELVWAARLWGVAEAWREAIGTPIPPIYNTEYQQAVDAARARLDSQAFDTAWTQGRSMKPEQVMDADYTRQSAEQHTSIKPVLPIPEE